MSKSALDRLSSLTLGTATFGMPYGIANPGTIPGDGEVADLLDAAWQGGITAFDTAPAYGAAEDRIGRWREARGRSALVVTKLPSQIGVPDDKVGISIRAAACTSAERLRVPAIDGYLTHGARDYFRPAVREALAELASEGIIGTYGPSVYSPEEAFHALRAEAPGIIQLPLNILDRRMADKGVLDACLGLGVAVFGRSVFLQGLVFLDRERLAFMSEEIVAIIRELGVIAAAAHTTIASLALRYVRDLAAVTSAVIGVYDIGQLRDLLAAAAQPPLTRATEDALADLARKADERFLDPRNWAG